MSTVPGCDGAGEDGSRAGSVALKPSRVGYAEAAPIGLPRARGEAGGEMRNRWLFRWSVTSWARATSSGLIHQPPRKAGRTPCSSSRISTAAPEGGWSIVISPTLTRRYKDFSAIFPRLFYYAPLTTSSHTIRSER
jgi:hypothetical protein